MFDCNDVSQETALATIRTGRKGSRAITRRELSRRAQRRAGLKVVEMPRGEEERRPRELRDHTAAYYLLEGLPLTTREVARMLAEGYTDDEVRAALRIGRRKLEACRETVRTVLSN